MWVEFGLGFQLPDTSMDMCMSWLTTSANSCPNYVGSLLHELCLPILIYPVTTIICALFLAYRFSLFGRFVHVYIILVRLYCCIIDIAYRLSKTRRLVLVFLPFELVHSTNIERLTIVMIFVTSWDGRMIEFLIVGLITPQVIFTASAKPGRKGRSRLAFYPWPTHQVKHNLENIRIAQWLGSHYLT